MDRSLVAVYAEEMMRLQDEAALAQPVSACDPGFSLDDAYAVAREVLARRERSGWRRSGRKIGFTNRTIYDEYGVYAPIFGYMYDNTVRFAGSDGARRHPGAVVGLSLSGDGPQTSAGPRAPALVQPRIEPEIAFKLRSAPPPTDDPEALLASIEWLAHGFEVVQCHFPGWRFSAADSVADGGLHGRYVVGPPRPVEAVHASRLAEQLSSFSIALYRDGALAAEGGGALVLDSPLNALAHLVRVLESLPGHPGLEAGELVTTGTLTAALPVRAGEIWSTRLDGIELPGLSVGFT